MKMLYAHCLAALTLLVTGAIAFPVAAQSSAKPADCAAINGPLPESWQGTAFAIDGDTLAGVGLKPHIRIWGIQAPELRDKDKQETAAGMRARAALDDLLAPSSNKMTCRIAKYDRYCRYVAQCIATGQTRAAAVVDFGAQMLSLGQAYGFYLEDTLPWEPGAGLRYIAEERLAREQKRGLWKEWVGGK